MLKRLAAWIMQYCVSIALIAPAHRFASFQRKSGGMKTI